MSQYALNELSNPNAHKQELACRIVKTLHHTQCDRGMRLIPERSRCIKHGDIHEIVVTDRMPTEPQTAVNRVGFLGFGEFLSAGVVEAGDELWIGGTRVGTVIGFDACHFPNHYNIIIHRHCLETGTTLQLTTNHMMRFCAPRDMDHPKEEASVCNATPIVVGFGRAGSGLHYPALKRLQRALPEHLGPVVYAVDRVVAGRALDSGTEPVEVRFLASLQSLPSHVRSDAVVHVCTPPNKRLALVQEALLLGYRKFILEKPMGQSLQEAIKLREVLEWYAAKAVVVSNWTVSALTERVAHAVSERRFGEVTGVTIKHLKPRFTRTMQNTSHISALDVEVPHMIALAACLAKAPLEVEAASTSDLVIGEHVIKSMGGAALLLRGKNPYDIEMLSNHASPTRERSVSVRFSSGMSLIGYFPCSSDDHFSQLHTFDSEGRCLDTQLFEDNTFDRFMQQSYAFFRSEGPEPLSGLDFSVQACALLDQARRYSQRVPAVKTALVEAMV